MEAIWYILVTAWFYTFDVPFFFIVQGDVYVNLCLHVGDVYTGTKVCTGTIMVSRLHHCRNIGLLKVTHVETVHRVFQMSVVENLVTGQCVSEIL